MEIELKLGSENNAFSFTSPYSTHTPWESSFLFTKRQNSSEYPLAHKFLYL